MRLPQGLTVAYHPAVPTDSLRPHPLFIPNPAKLVALTESVRCRLESGRGCSPGSCRRQGVIEPLCAFERGHPWLWVHVGCTRLAAARAVGIRTLGVILSLDAGLPAGWTRLSTTDDVAILFSRPARIQASAATPRFNGDLTDRWLLSPKGGLWASTAAYDVL